MILALWIIIYVIAAWFMIKNIADAREDKQYTHYRMCQQNPPSRRLRNAFTLANKDHRNERKRGIEIIIGLLVACIAMWMPSNTQPTTTGYVISVLFIFNATSTLVTSVFDKYDRKTVLERPIPRWYQWWIKHFRSV